jgi:chitinase
LFDIVLDGSKSVDPDNGGLTFLWSFVSGPRQPVISRPNSVKTEVKSMIGGEYVFQLKVTDIHGASDTDTVNIKLSSLR